MDTRSANDALLKFNLQCLGSRLTTLTKLSAFSFRVQGVLICSLLETACPLILSLEADAIAGFVAGAA